MKSRIQGAILLLDKIPQWSDRLGTDEIETIKEAIHILKAEQAEFDIIDYEKLKHDIVDNYATYMDISMEQAKELIKDVYVHDIMEKMYDIQTEEMNEIFFRIGG